jgi:hypothetical protein
MTPTDRDGWPRNHVVAVTPVDGTYADLRDGILSPAFPRGAVLLRATAVAARVVSATTVGAHPGGTRVGSGVTAACQALRRPA